MIGRFASHKMVAVREACFAALVGIRRLMTLVLGAAVRRLAIKRPACEAVEGLR
jgi:hypothetical protein